MKRSKIILGILILSTIVLVFSGCVGGGNPVVPPINNDDGDEDELKFWDGEFSGYQWVIKDGLQGPGPNYYSNSIDNVWKDDQGYLHLRITKRDNKWYCAEIYSEKEGWGYGKYEFELGPVKMRKKDTNGNISEVNYLDKKVVFGLFTYDSSTFAHKGNNEIDIEFAQWNDENIDNGNYTVWYASEQPQEVDKNNTFSFPIDIGEDTFHSFEWNYNKVVFSSNGSEKNYPSDDFIYQENYSSIDWGAGKDYIPISNEESKEKVHINLYWFQGPPTEEIDIEEIEVIIKSFQFTAEENGTYALRDIGPAGGYVFYDKGYYSSGWRYLEAAPASTEWTYKEWGSFGTFIGGTGTGIGTGQSNTTTIVAWLNNNTDDTYGEVTNKTDRAAYLCFNLVYGGYTDWFLPSLDELNLMYTNLKVYGVGGFADFTYWSSSEAEADAYHAWCQYFYTGYQTYIGKFSPRRVRAVRAF